MNDLNVSHLILTENNHAMLYLLNFEYVTFPTPLTTLKEETFAEETFANFAN